MLARCSTSMANSKKRSQLPERQSEPEGVLDQPHSRDGGFTVDAVAGGSTCGLRHETNSLVVPDRIGAHARPFRKLAYLQPLMLHHAILDARRSRLIADHKKKLDPGIVPRFIIEVSQRQRRGPMNSSLATFTILSVTAFVPLASGQHPPMPPGMSHEEHLKQMSQDAK